MAWGPGVGAHVDQQRNEVLEAINSLPEQLQLVFALRYEHGWKWPEIAACLRMTTREVVAAHCRAIELLRPALEPFAV